MNLALTLGKRLMLLVCVFLVSFFIVAVLAYVIQLAFGMTTASMRITTIIQDVFLFVIPPVVTALLVTRRPATLLCIDRPIAWVPLVIGACTLVAFIPGINYVLYLNEQLPLPQSLIDLEQAAQGSVDLLMGPHDIPNLLVAILVVGVAAGVSEELLFRGGLQRLLVTGRVNPHVAIWVSAAVFSLLHMQFCGFVPRLLLGAFFGYLLWWTGTLWVPVILHAFNNTLYLISHYLTYPDSENAVLNTVGHGSDLILVVTSFALTALGLYLLYRLRSPN